MRKLVLSLVGASALAISSAASAVVIVVGAPLVGDQSQGPTSFLVSPANAGDPSYVGQINATIGHSGIPTGGFTDTFQFTIPQTGLGSGSISTSVSFFDYLGATDLDITSVVVNGLTAFETLATAFGDPTNPGGPPFASVPCTTEDAPGTTCGANEAFFRNDVPITANVLNTITVTGVSRGGGSYGGNLTFTPVPEPATWAMMLVGFAGIGWQLRRRRSAAGLAQFA
jgi:PEP-CTERM motif